MKELAENLRRRGYTVTVLDTASECRDYLNKSIDGKTVGVGGSMSIAQLEVLPLLAEHNTVISHADRALVEQYGMDEVRKMAMSTEVYLSSVNAIAKNGTIINIDGMGNRIAGTAFGHKKVCYIIGKNKLAPDYEQAMWRARNIASPLNAKRLGRKTPCAVNADRCYDCSAPDRICRGFLITERPMFGQETEIVLVNEELGF